MAPSEPHTDNDGAQLAAGLVRGPQALAQALAALVRSARRDVRLFAPQLEPAVFGAAVFVEALQQFAARHARNSARLLVEDATRLLRDNARLVELARRLPDGLAVREIEDNDHGARDLYLVADRSAHLVQEDVGRNEAMVTLQAPNQTLKLIERFDATWERATPLALRTLGL